MNLIIEKCSVCRKKRTEVFLDDTLGDIFEFDLCMDCEDQAFSRMSRAEAIATLYRQIQEA